MVDEEIVRFFEDEEPVSEFVSKYATLPYGEPARRNTVRGKGKRTPYPSIRTRGAVAAGATRAWVYVAIGPQGMVKVGITSDVPARMRDLRAKVVEAFLVTPASARVIETDALARLGRLRWDGEWVRDPLEAVVTSVGAAVDAARRYMHVDPDISADEARQMRISLAFGNVLR
jgi:hypothetical protein